VAAQPVPIAIKDRIADLLGQLRRFSGVAQAPCAPRISGNRDMSGAAATFAATAPLMCQTLCAKCALGAGLDLLAVARRCDGNRARLHALGQVADQIDVQEAILELGALDLDVVGELEAALE